jgi:hypothetical protein
MVRGIESQSKNAFFVRSSVLALKPRINARYHGCSFGISGYALFNMSVFSMIDQCLRAARRFQEPNGMRWSVSGVQVRPLLRFLKTIDSRDELRK